MPVKKICICGGGALGSVIAGWSSAKGKGEDTLLTGHPESFSSTLGVDLPCAEALEGAVSRVSDKPSEVISDADIVLLCYPGYMIRPCLEAIKGYLRPDARVGSVVSSTGFFFEAHKILPPRQVIWGFQRAPFIARVGDYGKSAHLLGFKKSLNVAVEGLETMEKEDFVRFLSFWFETPVSLLSNFYEASLTNSNPLLHPARLYDLFGEENEGRVYPEQILFYEQWTERASQYLISLDRELFSLLSVLPVTPGFLPSILDYYESTSAGELSAKLRSIEAFKKIPAPMRQSPHGWVPDYSSRYFREDFPYGLKYVRDLAYERQVPTPLMDKLLGWGMGKCK